MSENAKPVISISGEPIELNKLSREELRRIYADARLRNDFYSFSFKGVEMILVVPREGEPVVESALQLAKASNIISKALGNPCIFYFKNLDYNRRNRLVNKGVFFIAGQDYVYLPMLLFNQKASQPIKTTSFQPCAQYLLLRQIELGDIAECSISKLAEKIPFGYVTITRAIRQLEEMSLAESIVDSGTREKSIHFMKEGVELWKAIENIVASPIKKVLYSDAKPSVGLLAGISALSEYSSLNPDSQDTVALTKEEYSLIKDSIIQSHDSESSCRIEVWSYPAIRVNNGIVDPLSLYLTLKEDTDPRVEKELEIMINNLLYGKRS